MRTAFLPFEIFGIKTDAISKIYIKKLHQHCCSNLDNIPIALLFIVSQCFGCNAVLTINTQCVKSWIVDLRKFGSVFKLQKIIQTPFLKKNKTKRNENNLSHNKLFTEAWKPHIMYICYQCNLSMQACSSFGLLSS